MRTYNDIIRICSDKRQLDHDFKMLLEQFNPSLEDRYGKLGLDFRPKARGFTRKSKAEIEVWAYRDFECRQRTDAVPKFRILLYVDKQLPRGVLRKLLMLWEEMPDYEVRDGALVRV